jgi:CheY-like chemotaxis protein
MATILVVDDRADDRQLLATLIDYYGHHVLEATDGAEALQIAQAERPDLIISGLRSQADLMRNAIERGILPAIKDTD